MIHKYVNVVHMQKLCTYHIRPYIPYSSCQNNLRYNYGILVALSFVANKASFEKRFFEISHPLRDGREAKCVFHKFRGAKCVLVTSISQKKTQIFMGHSPN